MGNTVPYVKPCSKIVIGNPDGKSEAFEFLKTTKETLHNGIQEFTPRGVILISHKDATRSIATTYNYSSEELDIKLRSLGVVGKESSDEDCAALPSAGVGGGSNNNDTPTLRQGLLIDVVYSVLSLLEGHTEGNSVPRRETGEFRRASSYRWREHPLARTRRTQSLKLGRKAVAATRPPIAGPLTSSTAAVEEGQTRIDLPGGLEVQSLVVASLQQIFVVSQRDIMNAVRVATQRKVPLKRVAVEVIEARGLRSKTLKERSNPYCLVRIGTDVSTSATSGGVPQAVVKTSVVTETLDPRWNSAFTLDFEDTERTKIFFDVWHSPNEKGLGDILSLKALRKEGRNLMGSANIHLQRLNSGEVDEWLKLTKNKMEEVVQGETQQTKNRGEIHVKLRAEKDVTLSYDDKKNFQSLLAMIAYLHSKQCQEKYWDGNITSAEKLILENYCHAFNISPEMTAMQWWLVLSSENVKVSQKHFYHLAREVKEYLRTCSKGLTKDEEELIRSVINWIHLQIMKVKELMTFYPPESEVHSGNELTFSLRAVKILEENIPECILTKTVHPFNICITEALQDFLKTWWKTSVKGHQRRRSRDPSGWAYHLKDSNTQETSGSWLTDSETSSSPFNQCITLSQLRATNYSLYRSFHGNASISSPILKNSRQRRFSLCEMSLNDSLNGVQTTDEPDISVILKDTQNPFLRLQIAVDSVESVAVLLENISRLYHKVFYREFKIPFFRKAFMYLSNELASMVEPLVHHLYGLGASRDIFDGQVTLLSMESETPLASIYKSIQKMERIRKDHQFSYEAELNSGFKDYWKWFSNGVSLWLKRTFVRAKEDVLKCLRDESFTPHGDKLHSSSANNVVEVHKMIWSAWLSMHWPNEASNVDWGLKIAQNWISLTVSYGEEMKLLLDQHIDEIDELVSDSSKMACVSLNNLRLVAETIEGLPDFLKTNFGFSSSEHHAKALKEDVERNLLKLQSLVDQILNRITEQVTPVTVRALYHSAKLQNVAPFSNHVSKEICTKETLLSGQLLKKYLDLLWKVIMTSFVEVIETNKMKQNHTFFVWLSKCLELTTFHLQYENRSFPFEQNERYHCLRSELDQLQKSNESLMSNFYFERLDDQRKRTEGQCQSSEQVVVRVYFTSFGSLKVNIIMAKDLLLLAKPLAKSVLRRQEPSKAKKVLPNTYVIAKLVPSQWFPTASPHRTKVISKTLHPVFDSQFELPSSNFTNKDKTELGFLQISLYGRQCCVNDRHFGDSFVALSGIPRCPSRPANSCSSDSSQPKVETRVNSPDSDHSRIPNLYLKITKSKNLDDYPSIQTLKLRTIEKSVSKFLKEIK